MRPQLLLIPLCFWASTAAAQGGVPYATPVRTCPSADSLAPDPPTGVILSGTYNAATNLSIWTAGPKNSIVNAPVTVLLGLLANGRPPHEAPTLTIRLMIWGDKEKRQARDATDSAWVLTVVTAADSLDLTLPSPRTSAVTPANRAGPVAYSFPVSPASFRALVPAKTLVVHAAAFRKAFAAESKHEVQALWRAASCEQRLAGDPG